MRSLIYADARYGAAFWAAYGLWFALEAVGSLTQRARQGVRQDRGSYGVLIGLLYAGLALGFWSSLSLPRATIAWHQPLLVTAGITLILGGLGLRWYAIRVLGRYFTREVAVQPDQQVVQRGPYRFIRHPAYAGTLLTLLGIGLAMTNWASIVAIMACGLLGHLYRVRVEERALCATLGPAYAAYMRRTRRFIPFLW